MPETEYASRVTDPLRVALEAFTEAEAHPPPQARRAALPDPRARVQRMLWKAPVYVFALVFVVASATSMLAMFQAVNDRTDGSWLETWLLTGLAAAAFWGLLSWNPHPRR